LLTISEARFNSYERERIDREITLKLEKFHKYYQDEVDQKVEEKDEAEKTMLKFKTMYEEREEEINELRSEIEVTQKT
jgi:hypothetical protein